jgi:hypothetical protein
MLLFNRFEGKTLKENLGRAAAVLPLVPKFTHDTFRPPIFVGPFEMTDSEGVPLIPELVIDRLLDRMRLPTRRTKKPSTPPTMGMPTRPPAPTSVTR